ncbi:hypothetical protein ACFQY4_02035 [Catellatospora bangladeshensis]|uniref:Uncharacterized protein n=1 Tax=Catellatospora bangladeshensis TaxID=310355 RepID=A0A8J3JJ53_9ACTN|nr:hypothetical protein [Catellatospora bangladeshensis]GIF85686.1 hypothetical protein Cba03nite_70350 [Catellatospora bangladeshensis]
MRTEPLIRRALVSTAALLAVTALGAAIALPAQAAAALPAQAAAPAPATRAGSPAATADKAATLDAAKKLTTARIDGRLAMLKVSGVAIRNAARLTDAHQAALQKIIDADLAGLTELRAKVAAETTVEAVRADARSMVEDYRVYLLVRPQVHLTVAADVESAALTRLRDAHGKLAEAVAAAKAAGRDVGDAEAKLAHLKAELDAVDLAGVADTLLAVEPGPDAAAIRTKTGAARAAVRAARTHLRAALADAKAVRDILKP